MSKPPNLCKGCKSYKEMCRIYLGKSYEYRRIFRERFCPCTTCIVKPMCDDKITLLHYQWERVKHKCNKLNNARNEFFDYLKERDMKPTIKVRRKRRKKK
jgi:hypothetical protein